MPEDTCKPGDTLCRFAPALALCMLLMYASGGLAKTGDFWSATTQNVPVYDGPDKSFPVQHYIGPSDIVRQKSDNKIRGFIKVEIPKYSQAPGYVLEKQLVFLGGTDTSGAAVPSATVAPAPTRPSQTPASEEVQPSGSGGVPSVVLLLVILVCGLAYLAYRLRAQITDGLRATAKHVGALRSSIRLRRETSESATEDEYHIFKSVADELDARQIDKALWTQALALSDGDAKRQEAIYVRLRAERLKAERRERGRGS